MVTYLNIYVSIPYGYCLFTTRFLNRCICENVGVYVYVCVRMCECVHVCVSVCLSVHAEVCVYVREQSAFMHDQNSKMAVLTMREPPLGAYLHSARKMPISR